MTSGDKCGVPLKVPQNDLALLGLVGFKHQKNKSSQNLKLLKNDITKIL